jgi:predicted ester cyclase
MFLPTNCLFHDPDRPTVRTREDYKQWVIELLTAFPDHHLAIEERIAEGDQVVTRWTSRGTHTGDLVKPMPLPATGKQFTISGIVIARFAGGKAIELWHLADVLSYLQQLGVIPAPA